jgi:hypothetical protein
MAEDGAIDRETECNETFEFIIPLPDAVTQRGHPVQMGAPQLEPHRHDPRGIFDDSGPLRARIRALRPRDTRQAAAPVELHAPRLQVGAVAPAMGGHYSDRTDPVFNKQPFTRTWIFGGYHDKIIFYENMVTRAFLLSDPDACDPIKSPAAVAQSGFYPTVSCVRHDPSTGERTVSPEQFVLREATAADPIALGNGADAYMRENRRFSSVPAAVRPMTTTDIAMTHFVACNSAVDCECAAKYTARP